MATIKAVWTENVNLHSSASLAFGASATDDIDLDNLGADTAAITIEIIFGGSPDGDVLVEIFHSTDSGSADDTEPASSFIIPQGVSATKRRTLIVAGTPYIAVTVTNQDSADGITYEAHFAWRQWNST